MTSCIAGSIPNQVIRCKQIIDGGIPFDAVCAGTDEAAIGILKCLHQPGLSVPEDVAVASIDNLDISAYTIPSLTTIDIPKDETGFHAISALINHDQEQSSNISITVRTHLIQRNSTRIR